MLAVDVRTSATAFEPGRPELLFEGTFAREPQGNTNYDVSADGEHFLMVQPDEATRMQEIVVVQNWLSELERLAPAEN